MSPSLIYELLAAIAQILVTIARNTGSTASIADLLSVYLPKLEAATGLTSDQLKANIEQAKLTAELAQRNIDAEYPNNPNLNDVDSGTKALVGMLGEIATT